MSEEENSKTHLNCSQKVLNHFAPKYGLTDHLATKIATGLGGGMGRMAGNCGAVSGAYLVLGLEYGPEPEGEAEEGKQAKEHTYSKVREFHEHFMQQHGSCTCKELLGCDISTDAGFEQAQDQELMKTRCPLFIDNAINIVEKMIKDDKIAASSHHQSEANDQNGT